MNFYRIVVTELKYYVAEYLFQIVWCQCVTTAFHVTN